MKWRDFQDGDVIAPLVEINKLKEGGTKSDRDIYKYVIIKRRLHSFPDLMPEEDYFTQAGTQFEELFSVCWE